MTAKTVLRPPSADEMAVMFRGEFPVAVPEQVAERVLSRLHMGAVGGCWRWQGPTDRDGYGVTTFARRQFRVHRLVYQLARGPLSRSLDIDHRCKVRDCANPLHLEAVPPLVNLFRGDSPPVVGMRRRACKNGHEFDAVDRRGWRKCRTCVLANKRRYRARLAQRVVGAG